MTSESAPVFIAGDGRSGTTLLSLIMDANPDLAVGPELHFRGPPDLGPYILELAGLRQRLSEAAWEELRKDPVTYPGFHFVNRCHRFGVEPAQLAGFVRGALEEGSALRTFSERGMLVDRMGEAMRLAKGARRWGIKVMRDLIIADQYFAVWPKAQFIHMVRDGRDVAASQTVDHASWGYAEIEAAAAGWVRLLEKGEQLRETGPIMEIRYEDLVQDPRAVCKEICGFLDVRFHEDMLRHQAVDHALFDHPYDHPSIDSARQPVNTSAVGRFRRDLSRDQIAVFEAVAREHLLRRGYGLTLSEAGRHPAAPAPDGWRA